MKVGCLKENNLKRKFQKYWVGSTKIILGRIVKKLFAVQASAAVARLPDLPTWTKIIP